MLKKFMHLVMLSALVLTPALASDFTISIADNTPVGTVITYPVANCPTGYLAADGTAVSRTGSTLALFQVISTSHGAGDGSTTFNLPDYRGRFLRGVDGAAGNDADKNSRTALATGGNVGNQVGSLQDDAFQGHGHEGHVIFSNGSSSGGASAGNTGASGEFVGSPRSQSGYGTARVATETRPKNVSVNYCIKK